MSTYTVEVWQINWKHNGQDYVNVCDSERECKELVERLRSHGVREDGIRVLDMMKRPAK